MMMTTTTTLLWENTAHSVEVCKQPEPLKELICHSTMFHRLGRSRQYGTRNSPNTSTYNWQWESNPRTFDLETTTLSTGPHAIQDITRYYCNITFVPQHTFESAPEGGFIVLLFIYIKQKCLSVCPSNLEGGWRGMAGRQGGWTGRRRQ